jgi:hypothetical protein
MSDPDNLSDFFNLFGQSLELITNINDTQLHLIENPKKSERALFDKRADDVISIPSRPANQLSASDKRAALDREFWESQ